MFIWRCTQEAEGVCLENREVGDEPARGFKSYHLRQKGTGVLGKKCECFKLGVYSFPTLRVGPKLNMKERYSLCYSKFY